MYVKGFKMLRIKLLWFLLQVLWLFFILYQIVKYNEKDIDIIFTGLEYIITFPSSLLIGGLNYILSFIYTPIDYFNNVPYRIIYIFINWILFTVAGYVQWFIVVPKIYMLFKNLK